MNIFSNFILKQSEILSRKWGLPKQDINSPDLYIPLMAFTTYVLMYGLIRGSSFSGDFTPEVLTQAVWRGVFLQLIESAIIKVGVNVLSSTLPFLDIFAYTGYKYVGLCINIFTRLFGGTVNFIISIYTASMLAYFILKTMAAVIPPISNSNALGPPRHLLLLAFAALQFIVLLILSWL